MDIHERLQYLRKQLKLTTRAFGASINMSGGAITNMEKGQRNITDRTVKDICREYNVNPVSYTHLDVYKRQTQHFWSGWSMLLACWKRFA